MKRSKPGAISRDRNSLGLIWTVNLAGFWTAIFLAFHRPAWAPLWQAQVYLAGCCLFAAGLGLRWYSIIFLGRWFTVNVAIAADQRLIESGPYRFIRHPSYTGGLLMQLGFGLCLGNPASLLMIFVPGVCACLWRIRIEEEVLTEAFGENYEAYRQKTKRLIPLVF